MKKVSIEIIIFLFISLVSIIEGFRLITYKDPKVTYDILGPGFYVLFISFAMLIAGVAYLIISYREIHKTNMVALSKEMRIRTISMILVLVIYNFLISFVGYIIATIIFFFLEFRLVGIKSWITNVILTLILTIAYYIIFVQYCNMVFPRGILF